MLEFETINEMNDVAVCGEPNRDAKFEVFSAQKGDTVFEGTWDELLDSPYADIPLASFDIACREGFIMCFNLDDEDWEYEEEDDE